MSYRFPQRSPRGFGGFMGAGGPPASDVLAILAVVFFTFTLQFFDATAVVPKLLRLSPLVLSGFVWQIVTYPFVGTGGASIWFLLELLILYWFAGSVYRALGRRRFWRLLLWTAVAAALAAILVFALTMAFGLETPYSFLTMQGQRMLVIICIAAFATINGDATILLFFVLPIKARWFLWLEILFAFVFGLLPTKDLAGFIGVCTAVFVAYSSLSPGGPRWALHRTRKQIEKWIIEQRLKKLRRRRRFDVIDGGDRDKDEWVH